MTSLTGSNIPEELRNAFTGFSDSDFRAHALQTRSHLHRDYLAEVLSGGRWNYENLVYKLQSGSLAAILHPKQAVHLAQIVTAQRLTEQDPSDALMLLETVRAHYGTSVFSDDQKLLYAELLDRVGRIEDARGVVSEMRIGDFSLPDETALEANLSLAENGPGSSPWLDQLNRVFALDGLAPLTLAPGNAPVLDRLESTSAAASVDGPLVTVILPTWRPGPWLWTAIRSLTQQTYANIQILVMDDVSGPEYSELLQSLLSMDARIEIITSPKNQGTYASRNSAVRDYARGEFITIQDDDDWSHPQRIERQVAHSLERNLAIGLCRAARVSEDLRFIRRAATFIRRGYPTTLIRKSTFTQIGFWDPVRRNSDFEFIRRARRSKLKTGELGSAPMMLQRHREGSLSSGEVWEGYSEQSRRWQNWLSGAWHERAVNSDGRLYFASGQGLERPYKAPIGLLRASADEPAAKVNAVLVADFGAEAATEVDVLELAQKFLQEGKTVGLLHTEGFRPVSGKVSSRVAALAEIAGVTALSWGDALHADVAHVFTPEHLILCDAVTSRVSAESAVIHRNSTESLSIMARLLKVSGDAVSWSSSFENTA